METGLVMRMPCQICVLMEPPGRVQIDDESFVDIDFMAGAIHHLQVRRGSGGSDLPPFFVPNPETEMGELRRKAFQILWKKYSRSAEIVAVLGEARSVVVVCGSCLFVVEDRCVQVSE